MSDPTPRPIRTAVVRDPRAAEVITSDLQARGVPGEHISARTATAPTSGDVSRTATADRRFAGKMAAAVGRGFLIAYLIGAVAGLIGASIAFAPPWASAQAAAIAAVVAFGVGWIAAGMGFLQAAIARAGERGPGRAQQPLIGSAEEHARPEWGAGDPGPSPDRDGPVELVIDVPDTLAAQVEAVLDAHRRDLVTVSDGEEPV